MARKLTFALPFDGLGARNWRLLLAIGMLTIAVAIALAGPGAFDLDPATQLLRLRNQGPSQAHLLGVDHLGRDVLARLVAGLGMSLAVASMALIVAVAAGVLPALLAMTLGGPADVLLFWIVDLLRAMPGVLLALVLAAVLGSGVVALSFAVGLTFAPTFALVTRATWRHERAMPYVHALQALGADPLRITFRHLLPNIAGPLVTQAAIILPRCIVTESVMSFLGLGATPDMVTWGRMIAQASRFFEVNPVAVMAPTVAVGALTLSLTVIGNAMRRRLDPVRSGGWR
jgi:ABC-type dipeptide/oligopeptide/nickel transport system permease subunit